MTAKVNILIVDDDVGVLETAADILDARGYSVTVAENGMQAIEQVKKGSFDVALIDVVLPGMNGVETYREIRKISPNTKAIIMTGYAVPQLVQEAINEEVYQVLYKPLDFDEVLELIESLKSGLTILVVDDDLALCEAIKDILAAAGHQVHIAGSGEEAVVLAREFPPALLFIDLKLPTINGLETYLAIREFNPRATAVIMTAYGRELSNLVEEALARDALMCLYKPFEPEQLVAVAEEIRQGQKGQCPR